jgi:DNA-binding NarL/FixJ family response regulator
MGVGVFTPSEVRVAVLVARGSTNREVAAALGLSAKTVEWHLSRLYRKVGVRSRTELALAWRFSKIHRDRKTRQQKLIEIPE